MSTAVNFATLSIFPFSQTATGPSGNTVGFGPARYVNGLTLAQVMQFYWNLETFTITTTGSLTEIFAGTTYTGTGNGSLALSPLAVSGDLAGLVFLNANHNVVMPPSSSLVSIGQTVVVPRGRVVAPAAAAGYTPPWVNFIFSSTSSSDASLCLEFGIEIDATDATKFAIRYGLDITYPIKHAGSWFDDLEFTHLQPSDPRAIITSGNFTVGGVSFPWWARWDYAPNVAMSSSGVGLSATSSDFTY